MPYVEPGLRSQPPNRLTQTPGACRVPVPRSAGLRLLQPTDSHASSVRTIARRGLASRHLVYCYWEPCNGDDIEEVGRHRKELAELVARVGAASPQIHHLTYCELWADWSQRELPAGLAAHVAALRERYELTVPPA
jgi:hypothetical protein